MGRPTHPQHIPQIDDYMTIHITLVCSRVPNSKVLQYMSWYKCFHFAASRKQVTKSFIILTNEKEDLVEKQTTLASKACLKISHILLAYVSDLPVSVAYRIVHLMRRASALPISLAENFTALKYIHTLTF